MDMLRDLRRKSLQLERADVERFRCPDSTSAATSRHGGNGRRGSLAADSLSADKKSGGSSQTGGRFHRSLISPFVSNWLSSLAVRHDPA